MSRQEEPPRLLADIGATNARFALQAPGRPAAAPEILAVRDWPSLAAAVSAVLAGASARGIPRPGTAVFAVACPILGDRAEFTNSHWSFSLSGLQRELGLSRLSVVNDFVVQALAVPFLDAADTRPLGPLPGPPGIQGTVGVLGPGSGLGVAGLLRIDGRWIALASEGGHVTLPAASEREEAVIRVLRRQFGHVSAERVLSGPGLVALAAAVASLDGLADPPQTPEAAGASDHPAAVGARHLFAGFLGSVAGNLALTLGARGGIVVAGGVVPKLGERFDTGIFRQRFLAKGRFDDYLAVVPTRLVVHPAPAFLGLAALADGLGAVIA